MDSLLASYASSDEEQEEASQSQSQSQSQSNRQQIDKIKAPKSLFQSLPPPKTLTPSIPQESSQKLSSLFAHLPQPKSQNPKIPNLPKKVVQFRPPINPIMANDTDDEDDEDDKEEQKKKVKSFESLNAPPSVKSFLSNIPAPKNSKTPLGALPSASGTARKSILEADVPVSANNGVELNAEKSVVDNAVTWDNSVSGNSVDYENNADGYVANNTSGDHGNFSGYDSSSLGSGNVDVNYTSYDGSNLGSGDVDYANYGSYNSHGDGLSGASNLGSASENYANYASYDVGYAEYGNSYPQYENKWVDRSSTTEVTIPAVESVARGFGKRGRNDVPQDIIEVKQDELIKNRPREDQTKLTGIAFGPSYQPISSAKGKPSKLHKRKHQIGTLYFDMKQREMELSERRAKGFLTKAETQAKYGW